MTRQNTINQILAAQDAVTQLKFELQLLEIAIEHCENYTEKNFNRVALLLAHLYSVNECHLDILQFALNEAQKICIPMVIKEKSPVV